MNLKNQKLIITKTLSLMIMLFAGTSFIYAQTNLGNLSGTGGNNSATYIGLAAGQNTTGINNTFIGGQAGRNNVGGVNNTFLGVNAGLNHLSGNNNTFLGMFSGRFNGTGTGNVFIGYGAGYTESGSNQLYIDNSTTADALIRGDFDANTLTFNGTVGVGADIPAGGMNVPDDIQLYVQGRFAQEVNGQIGEFGPDDRWISMGDAFAPPNVPIPDIYGTITQGYGASLITGSKSDGQNTIGFSGALDIDIIGAGGTLETVATFISNGSLKFVVDGDAIATGGWFDLSDRRYKEDIKTISNAMDKINALNGVAYNFKKEVVNGIDFSKRNQHKSTGFIAQDLEKVFPELVRKDDAGYYAVNYNGLIPVLVEAMKEQQDVIDEQAQEMLQQEEAMTDLQSRVERLEALLNNSETPQSSFSPVNERIDADGVILRQNAPNPSNGNTTIEYQLPDNVKVASLVIYDLNGRSIATYNLSDKGSIQFDASGLSNGTYAYAIVANGKSIASQKMIVQK